MRVAFNASPNVPRMFTYQLLDSAAFSVWQQSVLPKFVYDLMGDSNAYVGYVSAAMGVTQVFTGVGGSILSDRFGRREPLLRAAAIAGMTGAALIIAGAFLKHIGLIFAGMACYGVYAGCSNPNAEALFADSVATANRPTVYTYKWMVQVIAFVVGYGMTIALFLSIGNHWSYSEMQYVMAAGLGLHVVAFFAMLTLRDSAKLDKSLVESAAGRADIESDADDGSKSEERAKLVDNANEPPNGRQTASTRETSDRNSYSYLRESSVTDDQRRVGGVNRSTASSAPFSHSEGAERRDLGGQSDDVVLPVDSPVGGMDVPFHTREVHQTPSGSPTRVRHRAALARKRSRLSPREAARLKAATEAAYFDDEGNEAKGRCLLFTKRGIPFWVVAGDFLSSLAAGMTVRYFPLFFIHRYGVNPTALTVLFTISTVVVTAWAALAKFVATKVTKNRVTAAASFRFFGAMCMFYMAFAPGAAANFYPMAAAFIMRMAFMNSTFGLTRSVIMDHVPSSQRARWNAVESVTGFTWAGSAVVGGVIADHSGYRSVFAITASITVVAALLSAPAAFMVRDAVFASAEEYQKRGEAGGSTPPPAPSQPVQVHAAHDVGGTSAPENASLYARPDASAVIRARDESMATVHAAEDASPGREAVET